MGTLRSLTVLPKTKERYNASLEQFFAYLRREKITLPERRDDMDGLVMDYLEFLWSEGEGRAMASTFLAGLQDAQPKLKGSLPGSWRLMRTWGANELPHRAPPLSESVLQAMVGWAIMHEHYSFALSLMVGFHGLLRTGELLGLQAFQVHITGKSQPAVISLGLTKSGRRHGAAESVTITERSVIAVLWLWKQSVGPHTFLTAKPHAWRQMFSECLTALRLDQWSFRPYSLRRGGATFLFTKCGSLDRVLLAGRWTAIKTAKIYLNSGLAMLADIQIPRALLSPFHTVFSKWLSTLPSLEHTPFGRRSGGRGKELKKPRKAQKRGGRSVFFFRFRSKCVASLGCSPVWRGSLRGTGGTLHSGCGRMKSTAPLVVR